VTVRIGTAVKISVADHRKFLDRLRSPAALRESAGIVSAGINRTVTGDTVTYITTCVSELNKSSTLATTTTKVNLAVDTDPDPDPDRDTGLVLLVAQEDHGDRPSKRDVLRAAGLPEGVAKDMLTGLPARTRDPAAFPNVPSEFWPVMTQWMSQHVPSMVVLVRTDCGLDGRAIKEVEEATPRAMRSAVSLIGVRSKISEACDEFLLKHKISPLPAESVSILRLTRHGLIEHYRASLATRWIENKRAATRLADYLEVSLRQVATDLGSYLTEETLAGTGTDQPADVSALSAELETVRSELKKTQASWERDEKALREARRRQREAEHALALALGEDAPEEAEPTRAEPEAPEIEIAPASAEPEVESERSFESFSELLAAARSELSKVDIGDVDDAACTLDAHAKARVWRTRTWNTLVMMQRFAEQRELGANTALRAWLENHPGPLILPDNVVPAETTHTASSPEFRQARTFRVPVEVDPDGSAYFGAHVRIEPGRTSPAPRLHYYDDSAGSGKVYVGYLGPHLPSRRGE